MLDKWEHRDTTIPVEVDGLYPLENSAPDLVFVGSGSIVDPYPIRHDTMGDGNGNGIRHA